VDAVLGLSMTPRSLSVVVVGGSDQPEGGRNDAFEVAVDGSDGRSATERATAAVEAIAASRGERLTSIGVTWSDDADAEASLLMESLTESGFDNVVPIRLPEATEALARGMADVIGYRTSAVCVIEPDTAIALIVHTGDGAVQTAINHTIDSDESLIGWLSTVFARADWQPEALVVVGSAGGFDSVLPQLEEALSVPVFAPAEAPLALARGAALASSHNAGLPLDSSPLFSSGAAGRHSAADASRLSPARILTGLLVAGVVTFVASASVAVAVQLSPRQQAAPQPAVTAERIVDEAPVVRPAPVAVPPPAEAPVLPEPVEAVAPVVEPVAESVPPPEVNSVVDNVPAEGPYVLEAPAPPPPPPVVAPPTVVAPPPVVGPVYDQPKRPFLQRIRDKLRIGGDEQPPPVIMNPPMG
jgi:hypothetical protein